MAFDPVSGAFELGSKLIDRFFPDPKAKAEALLKLQQLQQSGDLQVMASQSEINKIEASNSNLFISGWRPFVGWICAGGLGTQFIIRPFFIWGSALFGHPTDFPTLDMGTLLTLLAGLLGLGGMRTYEKLNNVEKNR